MNTRAFHLKILRRVARYSSRLATISGERVVDAGVNKSHAIRARDIPTHMSAAELNQLYQLATSLGDSPRLLEIGSYLGASSRFLAAGMGPSGRLYCVDTWENETMPEGPRQTLPEFRKNVAPFAERITIVRKKSQDLTPADVQAPLDLVFIDGDHSYAAVKRDVATVSPWLADGKILAFHDCTYFEGVSRVVGEAMATGGWQLGGNVDSLLWLRKVANVTHRFPNS
jgi:predicted O-methyltransferase YrrM